MTAVEGTADYAKIFEQAATRHAETIARGDLFTTVATFTVHGSEKVRAQRVRIVPGYTTVEDAPKILATYFGVAVEEISLRSLL